jgi:hypothetical protein
MEGSAPTSPFEEHLYSFRYQLELVKLQLTGPYTHRDLAFIDLYILTQRSR